LLTPEQRTLRAKIAAHARWSKVVDRTAETAPARKALHDRLAAEVDPDNLLDPVERAKRVDSAVKAHMLRLSLKSSRARQSGALATAEVYEAELSTLDGAA
jgi:hypothetical protein